MNKKFWLKIYITQPYYCSSNYFTISYFINVDSVVLENIDLCDSYSYSHHTYIRPFRDEILTTIFILFSTGLYNCLFRHCSIDSPHCHIEHAREFLDISADMHMMNFKNEQ